MRPTSSLVSLGLLGLAAASPVYTRDVVPNYPPKQTSKGFNLVVNVTDPSADFSPSIQNSFIASIHTGAGLALVGITSDIASGRVFYQNGTVEENRYARSNVLSDGGTPPTPQGFELVQDDGSETLYTARMDFGPGTPGVVLSRFPEPYVFLLPETYLACNTSLEYYQGKHFITIKRAELTVGNTNIPKDCVAVRLVPQCATLADLPPDAYSSHEYALESACYKDVAALDWTKYGP